MNATGMFIVVCFVFSFGFFVGAYWGGRPREDES